MHNSKRKNQSSFCCKHYTWINFKVIVILDVFNITIVLLLFFGREEINKLKIDHWIADNLVNSKDITYLGWSVQTGKRSKQHAEINVPLNLAGSMVRLMGGLANSSKEHRWVRCCPWLLIQPAEKRSHCWECQ